VPTHDEVEIQIPLLPWAVQESPFGMQHRIFAVPGHKPETDLPEHEEIEIHFPLAF
jgi:hypothetical protein